MFEVHTSLMTILCEKFLLCGVYEANDNDVQLSMMIGITKITMRTMMMMVMVRMVII